MLKNLIIWEKDHGYKAKFIADKLGISESMYSKIKKGTVKPSVDMAMKLEKEFNVDALELLKNDEEVQ